MMSSSALDADEAARPIGPGKLGARINRYIDNCHSTRPVVPDAGFVEPKLAGWAHLVVEPEAPDHGRIFLGPQQAAGKSKLAVLQEVSPPVRAIVNCTNAFPNCHEDDSIVYCRIAVNDESGANILVYLEGAADFVRHQILRGRSVLVHCQMGVSRSATIVIAYLMKHRSMSRDEAYVHVKQRRPMANPNGGFWQQLELYGQRLQRERRQGNEALPNCQFDKDWAERSLATYQTVGHIADDPAELFREVTRECNQVDILSLAVDFIFGRGVLASDLSWFSALCARCRALGADPAGLVNDLFAEGSAFVEMWSGEVYSERIRKVMAASSVEV